MRIFVKDKRLYRSFFSMTAVIAMQNLISFAVNLADNIMIGDYSQTALSGVAMVSQVQFMLQMVILGIGKNGHLGLNEPGEHLVCNTHIIPLSQKTKTPENTQVFRGFHFHFKMSGLREFMS